MKKLVAVLIIVIISTAIYLNAGSGKDIPKGWFAAGNSPDQYTMGIDNSIHYTGMSSAFIKSKSPKTNQFATLMQTISAERYTGKRIRLTGYVKSENVTEWSGMWMRIDSREGQQLCFDNMRNRPIKGTTDWTKCSVVLDVPEDGGSVNFGVLLTGDGEVWCDDFKLEAVGKDVPVTDLLKKKEFPAAATNMDFEE